MAFYPPGGPTQIVFSFDTTGSMSAILDEVRGRLQDMIQRLQADIPGINISVVAHGDYCDEEMFYVTKHVDFTDNVMELCNFVNEVGGTGGGDVEECYELVLRLVRGLSWKGDSQKVLIMIGDAYPHEPDYQLNTLNLDWRDEVQELANMVSGQYISVLVIVPVLLYECHMLGVARPIRWLVVFAGCPSVRRAGGWGRDVRDLLPSLVRSGRRAVSEVGELRQHLHLYHGNLL